MGLGTWDAEMNSGQPAKAAAPFPCRSVVPTPHVPRPRAQPSYKGITSVKFDPFPGTDSTSMRPPSRRERR